MNIQNLQQQFANIGATLDINLVSPTDRRLRQRFWQGGIEVDFLLDVIETRRNERYSLTVRQDRQANLEFFAVDVQPEQRHLLLLAKRWQARLERRKEKYLCGHDERHWFVAAVPEARGVSNVQQAMEALKPTQAIVSQQRRKVKAKHWHKRHNAGFIRQGEWFFIPEADFEPDNPHLILRNEPIRRGRGQAHWVEYLYRTGGETVYVCSRHPNGLTTGQYRDLLQRQPEAGKWNWRVMRRNPEVYAKGKIRHPDHATIDLPFWHRVAMNNENDAVHAVQVVFLD